MQRTHVIDYEENNTSKMEHLEHVDSRWNSKIDSLKTMGRKKRSRQTNHTLLWWQYNKGLNGWQLHRTGRIEEAGSDAYAQSERNRPHIKKKQLS